MAASNFDHLLHPQVRYERVELPPEQNALASWQEADQALADGDELGDLACLFDPDCECGEATCLSCQPPPPSEQRGRLDEVLAKNAAARSHFIRGLEIGRLQVQLIPPNDFSGGLALDRTRNLARLNLCEGHLARLQGEPLQAATCYARNVKFGRMLADCDGSVVSFLVARAVQSTGMYALLRLAEVGPVSAEMRAILVAARESEIDVQLAAQVLRSELLQFNWPMLVSLAEAPGDKLLAKAAERFFPETADYQPDPNDPFPNSSRGMACHGQFVHRAWLYLFNGHPELWDAEETLRAFSLTVALQIAELLDDASRWEIEAELSPWQARIEAYREILPQALSPLGSFLAAVDENWRPPSDRKLRKLRDRLRSHRNPLGMMVADTLTSVGGRALMTKREDDSAARWERILN